MESTVKEAKDNLCIHQVRYLHWWRFQHKIEHGLCACTGSRTGAQTMLYLTCTMISIVDLAR